MVPLLIKGLHALENGLLGVLMQIFYRGVLGLSAGGHVASSVLTDAGGAKGLEALVWVSGEVPLRQ